MNTKFESNREPLKMNQRWVDFSLGLVKSLLCYDDEHKWTAVA